MPILVSCIPGFVAYIPGDAGFHHALAVVVVLLGTAAFVPGYRLHRRKALLALVTTGISLVLIVACFGETLNSALELIISLAGSSMLIGAHLLNRSFCRQCLDCKEAESCSATKIN
jgi:diacylglycerol kinase